MYVLNALSCRSNSVNFTWFWKLEGLSIEDVTYRMEYRLILVRLNKNTDFKTAYKYRYTGTKSYSTQQYNIF